MALTQLACQKEKWIFHLCNLYKISPSGLKLLNVEKKIMHISKHTQNKLWVWRLYRLGPAVIKNETGVDSNPLHYTSVVISSLSPPGCSLGSLLCMTPGFKIFLPTGSTLPEALEFGYGFSVSILLMKEKQNMKRLCKSFQGPDLDRPWSLLALTGQMQGLGIGGWITTV